MLELERIYGMLVSFLGESKQGRYDSSVSQYQFNCPYCAEEKGGVDNKYNLEVSLSLLQFHCWSCSSSGSLSKLIKRHGGRTLAREYFEVVKSIKANEMYTFDLFEKGAIGREQERLKLPKTYKKIDIRTCENWKVVNYLKERCIDQSIIDRFNIGYTEWNDPERAWSSRLIIPSYDIVGNLNFFVGRDFLKPKKNPEPGAYVRPKYKNCRADKNDVVFQESKIDFDADIYLVEGALDCIYGPNTVSMLGKTLTRECELFRKLARDARASVTVCLDGDTEDYETERICSLLASTRLRGRVKYIEMGKYKDFGEAFQIGGKRAIIDLIRSAKTFVD